MDNIVDVILTVGCISVPIGLLVASAIIGIRARNRYARELQTKIDAGYYANWSEPPLARRRRIIAAILVVVVVGLFTNLILLFAYQSQTIRIALSCVSGVLLTALVLLALVMKKLLK